MAGIEKKPEVAPDSVSLVPLLKGDTKFKRGPMFWHYSGCEAANSSVRTGGVVRDGDWKFLDFYSDRRSELYRRRRKKYHGLPVRARKA